MSIWAHANGVIMLDGIFFEDGDYEESIDILKKKILGEVINYGDIVDADALAYMPCGSEGSLDYNIVECSGYTNIVICGNLRDYENLDKLKNWYIDILNKIEKDTGFYIREHVFQARVEWGNQVVIYKPHGDSIPYDTLYDCVYTDSNNCGGGNY